MNVLSRVSALALFVIFPLLLTGCDSMDIQPKEELASEDVWKSEDLMDSYLSDMYSEVGYGFGNPMATAGLVDESINDPIRQGGVNIMSTLTPANRGDWELGGEAQARFNWDNVYGTIRDINIFLSNVEGNEVLSSSTEQTLLGEAYFLRAYFYHNLLKKFGGVPIIKEPLELGQGIEQYQVPRNTFAETINFIVADLDRAADRLSPEQRWQGTASKGAALALKSRVLLFAASDLFHDSPFSGTDAAKFVSYQGGSQQDRWQKAKDAAEAVTNLGQYNLPQAESSEEYRKLLLREDNPEFIWARYFSEQGGENHDFSLWTGPNGYDCWAGNMPTQQHVDAYENADGSQFEWEGADPRSASEPVDAENPYDDRDPRFNANIMHNGTKWIVQPSLHPQGIMQTGWYEHPDRGGSPEPGVQGEMRPGTETREGPVHPWAGTKTGYILKKFHSKQISSCLTDQAYNPWPFLRYAEVLLNYAEASAELGDTQDALRALNQVRNRVGMPDVPPDGGPDRTLMDRIRQEREVELAFEGHRYWDVRRWMISEEGYKDVKSVRVEGHLDQDGELLVEHRYDYHYNVYTRQERQWKDKNYFVPIPRQEMNRNTKLVQNPGY